MTDTKYMVDVTTEAGTFHNWAGEPVTLAELDRLVRAQVPYEVTKHPGRWTALVNSWMDGKIEGVVLQRFTLTEVTG